MSVRRIAYISPSGEVQEILRTEAGDFSSLTALEDREAVSQELWEWHSRGRRWDDGEGEHPQSLSRLLYMLEYLPLGVDVYEEWRGAEHKAFLRRKAAREGEDPLASRQAHKRFLSELMSPEFKVAAAQLRPRSLRVNRKYEEACREMGKYSLFTHMVRTGQVAGYGPGEPNGSSD